MRFSRSCAALPLLALACGQGFAPQYLVTDLRILGARARSATDLNGNADGDTGERLQLSALVANPGGKPLSVSWKACLPRQGTAVSPCADESVLKDLSRLDQIPEVVHLGEGESIELSVPGILAPFLESLAENSARDGRLACDPYVELPVIIIARAGDETQSAFKSVRLVAFAKLQSLGLETYVRNINPVLADVRVDPSETTVCGGGTSILDRCNDPSSPPAWCETKLGTREIKLCARARDGSAQSYKVCDAKGAQTERAERVVFQWYATKGTFESSGGGGEAGNQVGHLVTYHPPATGPFTLWILARDTRGGQDWVQREFP